MSFLRPNRMRTLYSSMTSSRLVYVLLVDAALTFILFTFLYQYHHSNISHSSSIVTLCRSFRATTSTGVANPFRDMCHESSTLLNTPTTFFQRFLLVTREIILGNADSTYEERAAIRMKRNWKVVEFVGLKMVTLAIVFGSFASSSHKDRSSTMSRITLNAIDTEEDSFAIHIEARIPSSPSLQAAPPAYSAVKTSPLEVDFEHAEETGDADEDDLPWILLALSLIGHLSIALFDQGALDQVLNSRIVRDKWVVFGFGLFLVGMIGIWWESTKRAKESLQLATVDERKVSAEEKTIVVIGT